jgi:hypothetical protein
MPDSDAVEVDTVGLRDQVEHLGGLLTQAMALVRKLGATTIPAQAFGQVGQPVHSASEQLRTQVGQAVTGFAGAWQELNKLATDFSRFVEGNEQSGVDSLKSIQQAAWREVSPLGRPPSGAAPYGDLRARFDQGGRP